MHSPKGPQMAHLSERIGSILQLAADEAAEITSTAEAETERLRREARADADTWLQQAHEAKQLAAAEAGRLRLAAAAKCTQAADTRKRVLAELAQPGEART